MKSLIYIFVLILPFISCSRNRTKDNPLEFTNDVDKMAYWSDYPNIVRFKGHSGNFACKTDSIALYSLAFKRKIGEITDKPILRAEVSAWVFANNKNATGNIVCAIDSAPGKVYVYLSDAFGNKLKEPGKWTYVTSLFYFPNTYNPDFILSSYFWNTGKEDIYIDDFKVKLTEY